MEKKIRMQSHSFSVHIAVQLKNLNEAIMIEHFAFWHSKNEVDPNRCFNEGVWFYCSIEGFRGIYPYLTPKSIRGCIDRLKKKGFIMIGEFNKARYDRTKWYSLSKEGALFMGLDMPEISYKQTFSSEGKVHLSKGQMQMSERSNAVIPKGNTIPVITTYITTNTRERDKKNLKVENIIDLKSFENVPPHSEAPPQETLKEAIEDIEGMPAIEVKILVAIKKVRDYLGKYPAMVENWKGQHKISDPDFNIDSEIDKWVRHVSDMPYQLNTIEKQIPRGMGRWLSRYNSFNKTFNNAKSDRKKGTPKHLITSDTASEVLRELMEEDQ